LTHPKCGEGDGVAETLANSHLLAVTVHGPAGALDLLVPAGAVAADVAGEYAQQTRMAAAPDLHTRIGTPLAPDVPLSLAGVSTGDLLVATTGAPPAARRTPPERSAPGTDPAAGLVATWFVVAALAAGVAGWCATVAEDPLRTAALLTLLAGALVGVLPVGRLAAYRVVTAPAFGAAAAFALLWDPHAERLPMLVGVTGLAAALVAAVGRALEERSEEALRTWIVAGAGLFLVTGLATLAGAPPRLAWAVLLMAAVLAARFVPGLAVDVPDQYLIDLERLAVTAWSARSQPPGKRGRSVVPIGAVAVVAGRGTRLVTAASTAVLVVALASAPLLLATATLPIDRIGARLMVFFSGGALLLAGRSYRHRAARLQLRTAGLGCWAALAAVLLAMLDAKALLWLAIGAIGLAVLMVVVAVAVGRGWRSAWWSRRAEVAEGLAGAFALASLVVATGWFRQLWEMASLWELSS
jgi:ESX secretion system protein EccD